MRVPLIELLEKLAVDREMYPYETQPWLHYDEDKGITCSAEVRMGPGGSDVEAEIQFLYDDEAEIPEEEEDDEDEKDSKGKDDEDKPLKRPLVVDGRMQVLWMHAEPITDDKWGPRKLMIKNKDYTNEIHDWEGKGCTFFTRCIQSIQMGELPDIDSLIKEEMVDESGGRGRRGRIGRKGLKLAQSNPHNAMKKGM